jgi:hypothetical protein
MKITSLKNLRITKASVTMDIVPLSLKGKENDLAKVSVMLELESPIAEDTTFLVPKISDTSARVLMPLGGTVELGDEDPIAEADISQLQNDMQAAFNTFVQQPTREAMDGSVRLMADYLDVKSSMQPVIIKAGEQLITLQYSKLIKKLPSGENVLETNVPLNDFVFTNQGGNKANIVILMPFDIQDPNKVIEAHWTNPGGISQPMEKSTLAGKVIVHAYWQYDPAVYVKYTY